jgi:tRNA-binding EMAP/Myf-like protein
MNGTMSLVTAQIIEIKKHPDAKKLQVCQVSDGKSTVQVVCGASNAQKGMITILAPVGSHTPKGMDIKAAELRGVESHGMLCSAKDLNLSDEGGIVDLPADTPLGKAWTDIDQDLLSSIPWHQYKECEVHFWNEKEQRISVYRPDSSQTRPEGKILSKTYFYQDQYHYRHFKI